MSILDSFKTLSNGVKIPTIGLGTWLMSDAEARKAVADAIGIGYRHVDTAQAYGNEKGVGEGLEKSGIDRESVFVTTKVAASLKSANAVYESIEQSLEKLGLDYADLVIIHSPQPWDEFRGENRYFMENRNAWKGMERAYEEGLCRSIGVSNFLIDDLENILEGCEVVPMVNQILCHPGNTPIDILDFCRSTDIVAEAYSPIGHGAALKCPEVLDMAKKYDVSPAKICMKYCVQMDTVVLPKTVNPSHMKDNADLDFVISPTDMEALTNFVFKEYGEDRQWSVFSVRSLKVEK